MSIESESEFFEIFEINRFRKYGTSFGEGVSSSAFGIDDDEADVLGQPDSCNSLSEDESDFYFESLIGTDMDFDVDSDVDFDVDFENLTGNDSVAGSFPVGVLSYDYEMDTVDTLNLVDQINAYTSDFWEFVSIIGDLILFKRPKYA
jgi:hypothetical protein